MKKNSPYSAAFTGCGFMLAETIALLPTLQAADADALLKREIVGNEVLSLGKAKTRARNIVELRRRFQSVPRSFWDWFLGLSQDAQAGALFFVLLKSYYLLFDLQLNVVVPQWRSARLNLTKVDVMLRLNEIAAADAFVDGWSEETKSRVCSGCLNFLRCAGMLDPKTGEFRPLKMRDEDFAHFIAIGEAWFLEACLLQPYEIERIKECLK